MLKCGVETARVWAKLHTVEPTCKIAGQAWALAANLPRGLVVTHVSDCQPHGLLALARVAACMQASMQLVSCHYSRAGVYAQPSWPSVLTSPGAGKEEGFEVLGLPLRGGSVWMHCHERALTAGAAMREPDRQAEAEHGTARQRLA